MRLRASSGRALALVGCLLAAPVPVVGQPLPLYEEAFETYGAPGEPPGWFDSAPGRPGNEAPGQFKTWPDPVRPGNTAFGMKGASGSFTHLRSRPFSLAEGFRLEGRLFRGHRRGHLGVTFFSSYPEPERYYFLGQLQDRGTVGLSAVGAGPLVGEVDTGVSLEEGVWYRFVLQTRPEAGGVRILARVWAAGAAEPATWQVEAMDTTAALTAGWIGLFGRGNGDKLWDDLRVLADVDPPVIRILEGEGELPDGGLYNRPVTPVIEVTDASPVTVTAFLDGEPFEPGTPVTAEGGWELAVTAVDLFGNRAQAAVRFEIDLTPPELLSISPPSGFLTAAAQVTLTGRVRGAVRFTVDGVPVPLGGDAGEDFSAGPLALAGGDNLFHLSAADAAGNLTQFHHLIVRDATPPDLTVAEPRDGTVVAAATVTVSGTVIDSHLDQVTVNGSPALLQGTTFTAAGVPLAEGPNPISVVATDAVGNASRVTLSIIRDGTAPEVRITESGAPLLDGSLFNRAVAPVVAVTDATTVRVELLLDGAPFVSGSAVEEEGSHLLAVTATDAAGNRTERAVGFGIDRTPPVFAAVEPADGSLTTAAQVTLTGRVTGAAAVTVDGRAAQLSGDAFTAGPLALAEGENRSTLVATDAAGNAARRLHRLVRDSTAPLLTVTAPEAGVVVATPSVTVVGTAADPHLEEVRVAGALAALAGESFSATAALAEGLNPIEVTAADAAGNRSRLEVPVTLDSRPPVIRLLAGGGELADGARFSRPVSPLVEVTDATEVTVESTLDGAPFTSGEEISAEGTHELAVRAVDAAGNSASRTVTFTVDVTPPAFLAVAPAAGTVLADGEVTLTGRVRGAVEVTVDGAPAERVGDDFTAGPFPLAEGEHLFALVAVDAAGNRTEVGHRLVRDSTAPQVALSRPAAGELLASPAVTALGTASDLHLESVTVNGIAAALSGGRFNATGVPLAEGENSLMAVARDRAGNVARAEATVVLDSRPPVVTLTDPAPGSVVPEEEIVVSGTAADAHLDRVEVNGIPARLDGDGGWSLRVPLAEGVNTLTARAFDRLAREATAGVQVTRDSTAPAVAITAPAEGARLAAETVTVEGTVADEEDLTVTVNGLPAGVEAGRFSVAEVPLVEGENRLIARVTDAPGNVGSHTRTLFRDTSAPELVASEPAAGALSVAPETPFRLTFSEAMAPPAAGAWRLETATGEPLAAAAQVSGELLTVTPAAPLPPGGEVRLVLAAALTDLAGNPLADPPTLSFGVADVGAPAAPVVEPLPPAFLCATALTLTGSAEAGARVEVAGGQAAAGGTAGAGGDFAVTVTLVPSTVNRLAVTAVDGAGNRSPETRLEVAQDCQPPQVAGAEREGEGFRLLFSEPVDPSTLAGAVTLTGAAGPVAGAVEPAAGGAQVLFIPAEPLPTGALRLAVATAVRDRAGNPLAYPFSRLFGGEAGVSFLAGVVLDDATGRPLAGARVTVVATDGLPPAEPLPEQTTGAGGGFQLPLAAGDHRLVVARPGYTPVLRRAVTVAGAGTDLLDPRLTPAAETVEVGAEGGVVQGPAEGAPGAALSLPAGALAAATPVAVTPLGEQGLPALLPYGWSPRGAAWVDLGGAPLAEPATLTLPVEAPDGVTVTLVGLDAVTLRWRVLRTLQVEEGRVTAAVAGEGGYAAVEADSGPLAPPAPVPGEVLGASPPPQGGEVLSATLSFEPAQVLPGQRALATVIYDLAADVASGAPLTLVVAEELALLDGSLRREAPYRADLLLFRSPAGTPRSRFHLQPSEAARLLAIEAGVEEVSLGSYGGQDLEGGVVGPAGGSVTSSHGDRVDLPEGALEEATAVVLERLAEADLPLAAPAGGELVGALRLDLGGRRLALPAGLAFALSPAPEAGAEGLLLAVEDLGSGPFLRPVARLRAGAAGWVTAPVDPADLPWPGVVRGGTFLLVRLTSPHAFLRGTVFDLAGSPLAGALVTSPGVEWAQLSGDGGRYAFPAPVGEVTLAAADPATGNRGEGTALLPEAGARVDLDLALVVVAPAVVEVTPADGAVDLLPGVRPTVRFSEPVERASLAAGVELRLDGQAVAVDLTHQGSLVTLVPRASLQPGATYQLRVTGAVRDLQGYHLASPVTATFTTRRLSSGGEVDLARVLLVAPDAAGLARVVGRPGAVPAGSLVFAENVTSPAATPSVEAGQDGAFELEIAASLTDRLLLHVLVDGGNEQVFELGPFVSADLRTAYVGSGAATFTTGDGITVEVAEGTFSGPTAVRLVPATPGSAPGEKPPPAGYTPVYAFDLSFDGGRPARRLGLRLPVPAGAGGDLLVMRPEEVQGRRGWMLFDHLRREGEELTNQPPPDAAPDALTARQAGVDLQLLTGTGSWPPGGEGGEGGEAAAGGGAALDERAGDAGCSRYDCVPGVSLSGRYEVWDPTFPVGFVAVPFTSGFEMGVTAGNGGILARVNGEIESLLAFDAVCIPAALGEPVAIQIYDVDSGIVTFDGLFEAPPAEGEVQVLPPDSLGDRVAPYPAAGRPLRFALLDLGEGALGEVSDEIDYQLSGTTLTVSGGPGATGREAQVRLLGLDDEVDAFLASAPDGSFTLEAPAREGRRYLLALGAVISSEDSLEVGFSEALAEGFPGLQVLDGDGRPLAPEVEPVGSRATVRVRPAAGWPAGREYTLRLGPELADAAGNAWGEALDLRFRVAESRVVGSYPALPTVRDVARLGSWLFVAAEDRGLAVLDAREPERLRSVVPGDVTFPFQLDDPVRGVAVDPHGRVIVVGGGLRFHGQLKIFDPLRLDPAAVAANPGDSEVRNAAFRGATRISDQVDTGATGGTQLREGYPRRVVVLSDDARDRWRAGEAPPAGITVAPAALPEGEEAVTITVTGTGVAGLPVTLRSRERGSWARVDAGPDGSFSLTLAVTAGERLELLRNRASLAYVAILGAGLAVVDVNAVYSPDNVPSDSAVIGLYGEDPSLLLCNEWTGGDLGGYLIDLAGLFDRDNPHPLTVAGLALQRGLLTLESDPNDAGRVSFLAESCADFQGSRLAVGIEAVQGYRFDLDGDGERTAGEERDYVLLAHSVAGVLVYDVTDRTDLRLVGRVRVPGSARHLSVDRSRRRLYVSGAGAGLYVVDFDRPPSTRLLDASGDGVDDRVLETIELPGNTNAPPLVVPELGLVYVGGVERALTAVAIGPPELVAVVAGEGDEPYRIVLRLAPFGVPTAVDPASRAGAMLPGAFRLLAALPGSLGPELRLEVLSLGPGGVRIAGTGGAGMTLQGLPPAALTGLDGVRLRRRSDNPLDDGYHLYLSEEITLVADLRASQEYARSGDEEEGCRRCDPAEEGVGDEARELLSGDRVAVRFGPELGERLARLYTPSQLAAAELALPSVRWEVSPAVRQEPALYPSTGSGDAVPGTLLHSGEMTLAATDLALRGRELAFAFTRTWRSQTVGSGPLGPGWDFGYRMRLRELPDGAVELYDGRGRVETFEPEEGGDGTAYRSPRGWFVSLRRTSAGWRLTDPAFQRYRFDRFGRLVALADGVKQTAGSGNELTFHYDAASRLSRVRDSLGRDVTLEYDDEGRLVKLRDFDGREVGYEYDELGRLSAVTSPAVVTGAATFPAGLTTRYGYESPAGDLAGRLNRRDNLISVTDARGQTWLELTYGDADGDGRRDEVVEESWGGHSLSLAYDFGARQTRVTDRRGQSRIYQHNHAGQVVRLEDPVGGVWQWAHDGEGLLTSETTALGRVTRYAYDAPCEGEATGGGGPGGSRRRSRGNLTRVTVTADPRGVDSSSGEQVTCIDYEERSNRPVRVVSPRGRVTEIERDEVGLPVRRVEAAGTAEERVTELAYNDHGQLTRRVAPNGHVTELAYFETGESEGYLHQVVVDPGGLALTTRFETDARGNVTAHYDPRGVRHERVYNELDWRVSETRAASAASDGSLAPALGHTTTYLHDANGNLAEVRRPYGDEGEGEAVTAERFTYGVLGELLRVEREIEPGGPVAVERFEYGPGFLLTARVGPDEQRTEIQRDARGLPVEIRRGAGTEAEVVERRTHDLEGRPTVLTDGRGQPWSIHYDGYGRVRERRDPLGNGARFQYDDHGNLTRIQALQGGSDELLAETGYVYDLLDRPVEERRSLLEEGRELTTRRTYDTASNLLSVTDPLGRVTGYGYDAAGRRISATDPAGNRVELTRDPAGNVTEVRAFELPPGGGEPEVVRETRTYDAAGRLLTREDALGNRWMFFYTPRDQVRFAIDPQGYLTEHRYDGLDRRVETTDPAGVRESFDYDASSRLVAYRDALGNVTRYEHDALDRPLTVTYPDSTTWQAAYDGAGNPVEVVDANGSRVAQRFDAAGRLTAREVVPGPEVVGPTQEAYAWDGLFRLTQGISGLTATRFSYDSLSRLTAEQTGTRTVRYRHDDAGNRVELTYPSGRRLVRRFDLLDRPVEVARLVDPAADPPAVERVASYGYQGPWRVATTAHGNGLAGRRSFDPARRLLQEVQHTAAGELAFGESLAWSPRSLKVGQFRGDLGGAGLLLGHDSGGRLIQAARRPQAASSLADNSVPDAQELAGLPDRFAFTYDPAQNLTARETTDESLTESVNLPLDPSGRNRPNEIDGVPLAWDANGNLIRKGNLRLQYDFRNRLTRVSRWDDGAEIVRYQYDAFDRRVAKSFPHHGEETVWSGYREIEGYQDGALSSRRTFGLGLDEIIQVEADLDSEPGLEASYVPLYDDTGNVVAVTAGSDGRPLERYLYTPYGEESIRVDLLPPGIHQVRVVNGELRIELTEEVQGEPLEGSGPGSGDGQAGPDSAVSAGAASGGGVSGQADPHKAASAQATPARAHPDTAIPQADPDQATLGQTSPVPADQGQGVPSQATLTGPDSRADEADPSKAATAPITLTRTDNGEDLPLSVTQPVIGDRQLLRRLVLTPTEPPPAGTDVTLRVEPAALADFFLNHPEVAFELTFPWPEEDTLLFDDADPEVLQILLRDFHLEIEFTEEVDLTSAHQEILLDGEPLTWTHDETGYRILSVETLTDGPHQLTLGPGLRAEGQAATPSLPPEGATTGLDPPAAGPEGATPTIHRKGPAPTAEPEGLAANSPAAEREGETPAAPRLFEIHVDPRFPGRLIFRRPDPREIDASTVRNLFTFHGRPLDPETGLLYFRHRYYDPQLARFTTPDPLGYVDGPSLYAFAGNSPLDHSDPLGLADDLPLSPEQQRALVESVIQAQEERAAQWRAFVETQQAAAAQLRLLYDPEGTDPEHFRAALAQHFQRDLGVTNLQQLSALVNYFGGGPAGACWSPEHRFLCELASDAPEIELATHIWSELVSLQFGALVGAELAMVKGLYYADDLPVPRGTAGLLARSEAAGGHLIARHVGQPTSQLSARLAGNARLRAASTFESTAQAEGAVAGALEAGASQISTWVAAGARGRLVLNAPFSGGSVLVRGASGPVSGTGVRVVLQGNGSGGWHILTGFPTP